MNRTLISLLAACSMPATMLGWGQKGHDVTAAIAERHLKPAVRAMADSLLDGRSLVYWANWLDNASHTPELSYSRTWHYKNVDAGQTYETAPQHQAGDIVTALRRNIATLRNPRAGKEEKALALKMVVHLAGDMHQPMHMGHASDLGGNKTPVKFFDSPTNLHSVWDSRLPESGHKWSYTEWTDQLDRVSEMDQALLTSGNIDDWARDTYIICRDVYAKTPKNTVISYDYIATWTPTVEQQLLKAGLRLARILNAALDPAVDQPEF
ncbi:MAG: S1/P1 nuclease [Lepagella sp.]